MNYKGFKKVQEDDHKATMQNKHGHSLIIAKRSLTPRNLEILKKLPIYKAEGGAPQDDPQDKSTEQSVDSKSPGGTHITINAAAPQAPAPGPAQPPPQPQTQLAPPAPAAPPPAEQAAPPEQAPVPEPEPAPERAPVSLAVPEPEQTPEEHGATVYKDLNEQADAVAKDYGNGHVTPKTYSDLIANKSLPGKIGTIFGLLVSGAGAGLSHQPNALLEMMNREIDRDLDAQKQSKAGQVNFLNMNLHRLNQESEMALRGKQGKLTEAQTLGVLQNNQLLAQQYTKTQMILGILHRLTGTVDTIPPGPQKAAAVGALQKVTAAAHQHIQQGNAQTAAQVSANSERAFQGMNQTLRAAGALAGEPGLGELAAQRESHHFPGVKGQSSTPLSGADREGLNSGITFDRQLNEFMDWTKHHSGDLKPADIKTGIAKAAQIQAAYRQATHGGVYKEGEQNFISKIISDNPTAFFNKIRVLPQLKAVADDNHTRVDQLAKNLGFQGYESQMTQGDSGKEPKQEKKAPAEEKKSKSGRPIELRDGKWVYKK